MEWINILLNPYILLSISILSILAVFLSSKLNISVGPFKFGFIRNNFKQEVKYIINVTKAYTLMIESARCNILRNQMNHFEQILSEICVLIDAEKYVFDTIKLKIKTKLKENGIEKFSPREFSIYVGNSIDEVRNAFRSFKDHPFLDDPQFSDKIGDGWNHALATVEHWSKEITKLESELDTKLAKYM